MTHYYAPPTEISVVEDSWILIAALAVIGVIGLGIFISGFSTFLAVNKYLRLKIYNLYR